MSRSCATCSEYDLERDWCDEFDIPSEGYLGAPSCQRGNFRYAVELFALEIRHVWYHLWKAVRL